MGWYQGHSHSKFSVCSCVNLPSSGANTVAPSAPSSLSACKHATPTPPQPTRRCTSRSATSTQHDHTRNRQTPHLQPTSTTCATNRQGRIAVTHWASHHTNTQTQAGLHQGHLQYKFSVCSCVNLPSSGANAFAPSAPSLLSVCKLATATRRQPNTHAHHGHRTRHNVTKHAITKRHRCKCHKTGNAVRILLALPPHTTQTQAGLHQGHSLPKFRLCSCGNLPSSGANACAPSTPTWFPDGKHAQSATDMGRAAA